MKTQFERVDFFGGPDEHGKDVICWKRDVWGTPEATLIQIKRLKPTRRARDTKSFSEVVTQLSQALESSVPFIDGASYVPREVQFITPFSVDTRTLLQRFDSVPLLKHLGRKIVIVDGERLTQALIERCPTRARELLGEHDVATSRDDSELSNAVLMRALGVGDRHQTKTFYVDRDFIPGSDRTRLHIDPTSDGCNQTIQVSAGELPALIEKGSIAHRFFNVQLFAGPPDTATRLHHRLVIRSQPLLESMAATQQASEDLLRQKTSLRAEWTRVRASLIATNRSLAGTQSRLKKIEKLLGDDDKAIREGRQGLGSQGTEKLRRELVTLERSLNDTLAGDYEPYARQQQALDRTLQQFKSKQMATADKLAQCTGQLGLRGRDLSLALGDARRRLQGSLDQLSSKTLSSEKRRQALLDINALLSATDSVLSSEALSRAAGYSTDRVFADLAAVPKVTLATDSLLATDLNFILLGEAGAGKTTTLQSFARSRIDARRPGEVVLFVPLVRLVAAWPERDVFDFDSSNASLEAGLSHYLLRQNVTISIERLESLFSTEGGVLLLDGLDEVIKAAPWITAAISRLASQYPSLQIISSSRLSTPGLNQLGFHQLTLLPFTSAQVRQFVDEWFKDDKRGATLLKKHLRDHPAVGELVRNPLLATILCVLREHGVALPDTEVRLYEERLNLLLGLYDLHKGTQRMRSLPAFLRAAAQHLAFVLHERVVREETLDEMRQIVRERFAKSIGESNCDVVVDELIDPCNILFRSSDGRLNFDHLRHQEYLAAVEVLHNRAIDIRPLFDNPWWSGVFVLLSQMSTSIDWLIDAACLNSSSTHLRAPTLRAMISVRPAHEQQRLLDLAFWRGEATP